MAKKKPGKGPESNALWQKWIQPSKKRSAPPKTPRQDLYTEPGDNITRPRFDRKNPKQAE